MERQTATFEAQQVHPKFCHSHSRNSVEHTVRILEAKRASGAAATLCKLNDLHVKDTTLEHKKRQKALKSIKKQGLDHKLRLC